MKLGISQLAFDTELEFINSIKHLKQSGISYIEIVLPKIIEWNNINLDVLQNYVDSLSNAGLTCNSTQSITYNTTITSFLNKDFFHHIVKVIDLCKITKTNTIVLGAPKLRDIYDENQLSILFKDLDLLLRNANQILCIEPNCTMYGGKFFTNLGNIVVFLKRNNFTNIKTMIDSHNLLHENLDLVYEYIKYKEYIYHVHISEVGLGLFNQSNAHLELSQCLKKHNYNNLITYEVANQTDQTKLLNSISQFTNIYK